VIEVGEAKKKSKASGCLKIFFGIGASVVVLSQQMHFLPKAAPDPVSQAIDAADKQNLHIRLQGEAAVKAALRDPASADISGGFGWRRKGEDVACGYVNARNGFGAMAGRAHWVVTAGEVTIESPANASHVSALWNRLCVGHSDDLKSPPNEFLGVRLGSRPGAPLRAYDANRKVWVFGDTTKRAFLGVDMIEPTFTAGGGRIFGAQATASGKVAFDTLRRKLFAQFGVPTSDSPYQHPETKWDWGQHGAVIDLTYDSDHDRVTFAITRQE
jgi:hypothetical protein